MVSNDDHQTCIYDGNSVIREILAKETKRFKFL